MMDRTKVAQRVALRVWEGSSSVPTEVDDRVVLENGFSTFRQDIADREPTPKDERVEDKDIDEVNLRPKIPREDYWEDPVDYEDHGTQYMTPTVDDDVRS